MKYKGYLTISEAVLSLKLFYPVSNVCSSKCLNFTRHFFDNFITSASKLPRSFLSGNTSKMPVKCQYKFLTRVIFIPNRTFLVRFGGISREFGRAMVCILARRSRAIIPMVRPNEPGMLPKRTKKGAIRYLPYPNSS